jgi:hypothetical protein
MRMRWRGRLMWSGMGSRGPGAVSDQSREQVLIEIKVRSVYSNLEIRMGADAASKDQVAEAVRQAASTVADMISPKRPIRPGGAIRSGGPTIVGER